MAYTSGVIVLRTGVEYYLFLTICCHLATYSRVWETRSPYINILNINMFIRQIVLERDFVFDTLILFFESVTIMRPNSAWVT